MSNAEIKPLNWTPEPGIGYRVVRRPDGGMNFTFTQLTPETLKHWREFAMEHLYDSDRLTRNLYDLRSIQDIPEEAVEIAVEANSDPSARNIRLAVVVASESVLQRIQAVADLTAGGGVDMAIFTSIEEAEAWLMRPLTQLI